MSEARYAVYHAPAVDSPWWRFGAGWLGWDEQRGAALPQPRWAECSPDDFRALTAEPRRYGFHATLKAPFRLRPDVTERALLRSVDRLAAQLRRVELGCLEPVRIGDFIALAPVRPTRALEALAQQCVTELDDLRAPLAPEELARRQPERLDPRARRHLEEWGYPWVLDLFRFHMTLSGPVDAATGDWLAARAAEAIENLNAHHPACIDRLCVFREDRPGAPFVRIHDADLLA